MPLGSLFFCGVESPISSRGWNRRRDCWFLIGIGFIAVSIRAVVAVLTTSWIFSKDGHSWSFAYEMGQIAASLASGNGFSWPEWSSYPKGPTAWMPPIYPFLIAATFRTFGVYSNQAAIFLLVFQTSSSVLTCFLLYMVGKRIFNAQAGLLAALLFAVYPASINFAVRQIWSVSLFSCCFLVLILSLLKLGKEMNVIQGTWVGVLAGVATLVDPIIVASFPFVALWLYVNSNRDRVATCKVLAVTMLLFFVCVSPWLVRNYVIFGQFVFIKSNFGNELFLGNNPYATGSYWAPRAFESLTDPERESLKSADEPSRNRFLLQKAIAFISTHPLEFLKLTMSRFVHYWSFMMRPVEGLGQSASLLTYFTIMTLGIMGLLVSNARAAEVQLLWLFVIALALPYHFTVVGLFRYRFPVETVLVLSAAYAIHRMFTALRTVGTCRAKPFQPTNSLSARQCAEGESLTN